MTQIRAAETTTLLRPRYKNEQLQVSEESSWRLYSQTMKPRKTQEGVVVDGVQQDCNMLGIVVAEAGRLAQDRSGRYS